MQLDGLPCVCVVLLLLGRGSSVQLSISASRRDGVQTLSARGFQHAFLWLLVHWSSLFV